MTAWVNTPEELRPDDLTRPWLLLLRKCRELETGDWDSSLDEYTPRPVCLDDAALDAFTLTRDGRDSPIPMGMKVGFRAYELACSLSEMHRLYVMAAHYLAARAGWNHLDVQQQMERHALSVAGDRRTCGMTGCRCDEQEIVTTWPPSTVSGLQPHGSEG